MPPDDREQDAARPPGGDVDLALLRRRIERYRVAAVAVALAGRRSPAAAIDAAEQALTDAAARGSGDDDLRFGRAALAEVRRRAASTRARAARGEADREGRAAPDDEPPSEAETAPGPADARALQALVERGLLERRPGTGVVVRGDLAAVTAALLGAVPPDGREPLALRTYGGLGYPEIALLLDLTEDEVAARIGRAMLALREAFAAAPQGEPP